MHTRAGTRNERESELNDRSLSRARARGHAQTRARDIVYLARMIDRREMENRFAGEGRFLCVVQLGRAPSLKRLTDI